VKQPFVVFPLTWQTASEDLGDALGAHLGVEQMVVVAETDAESPLVVVLSELHPKMQTVSNEKPRCVNDF
jgi:hypothetical protein